MNNNPDSKKRSKKPIILTELMILLLTLGLVDEDWSAWYRIFSRNRFDEEKTAGVMLAEMLTEVAKTEPFVVSYPPL